MNLAEIRSKFLEYFKNYPNYDHTIVKSSSLIPHNDKTLLFTNAGMVQFKDVFLGQDKRSYSRAVSVQKCLRAGGKHNDLENVGYTERHHTFFEMLGNFSFGDYFKKEAIEFAWRFLTEVLKIPKERLWVTVYTEDDESADIWLNYIKVDPNRLSRCGEADNFWSMGDTGPCGPCTEIFYDHGPEIPGGPPGSKDDDLDRYIEIWNLVFMQYNRDANGNMTDLPKQSVDTGMGLERIAAVVQNVHSNYEIDLFTNLINNIKKIINNNKLENTNKSLRVLADHIRSCSFLIIDGIIPSNEGRGYVLRRIIRRAIRHGQELIKTSSDSDSYNPFFYKLVEPLCKEMGDAYPDLLDAKDTIELILKREEEQFIRTLDHGLKILISNIYENNSSDLKSDLISGEVAFKLYDTYGFPIDLTIDIAREHNKKVDIQAFEKELLNQKQRSKSSSSFKNIDLNSENNINKLDLNINTEFTGYEYEKLQDNITADIILNNNFEKLDKIDKAGEYFIISKSTPFYAAGGGQVGDTGVLSNNNFTAQVVDTNKIKKAYLHKIIIKNNKNISNINLNLGDKLIAEVDLAQRLATARNHSATHLLHAALRKYLGNQVIQKGSYVGPDYLRFDFSYFKAVDKSDLELIEQEVNQQILQNTKTKVSLMSLEQAIDSGAMALFGEKYDDQVRVLNFGNGYSVELCGGTHVASTGDIGLFVITTETSVSSGVRRIEALTGNKAREYLKEKSEQLDKIASLLKTNSSNLENKIINLQKDYNNLLKEIEKNKAQALNNSLNLDNLDKNIIEKNDIKILVAKLEGIDNKSLRNLLDKYKSKLQKAVILLASVDNDNNKVNLIAGVTNNCTDKIHAGKLVNIVATELGGKGGGRPDMAQAGAKNSDKLDLVLSDIIKTIEEML